MKKQNTSLFILHSDDVPTGQRRLPLDFCLCTPIVATHSRGVATTRRTAMLCLQCCLCCAFWRSRCEYTHYIMQPSKRICSLVRSTVNGLLQHNAAPLLCRAMAIHLSDSKTDTGSGFCGEVPQSSAGYGSARAHLLRHRPTNSPTRGENASGGGRTQSPLRGV